MVTRGKRFQVSILSALISPENHAVIRPPTICLLPHPRQRLSRHQVTDELGDYRSPVSVAPAIESLCSRHVCHRLLLVIAHSPPPRQVSPQKRQSRNHRHLERAEEESVKGTRKSENRSLTSSLIANLLLFAVGRQMYAIEAISRR